MKLLKLGYLIAIIGLLTWSCKEDTPPQSDTTPSNTFPMQKILLNDLGDFKEPGANWQLAGEVYADRNEKHALDPTTGKGILVCLPSEAAKDNLFTNFEHEDLDLELDVLIPKGSNSGIYLMSRYEIQLFDSWGKEEAKHSDMGGIYQRWDESRPEAERGYEGRAPLVNAAKAPGLWQHVRIIFKAPRFDASGNKIRNAIFKEVYLNGTLVQKDQEVSGPTRAAAFDDEVQSAPLMLQGDHGPVAFRNIQYKKYKAQEVGLSELTVEKYDSRDDTIGVRLSAQPEATFKADTMSFLQAGQNQGYLLKYDGNLQIPLEGEYYFTTQVEGGAYLIINGDTLIDHNYYHGFGEKAFAKTKLQAGSVPFQFVYNKPSRGWRRSMALFIEGEEIAYQPLHAPSSVFISEPDEPIHIYANNEVVLQRSFIMHDEEKRTHVISVGSPAGVHYTYALDNATLLQAWHGKFLDATPMWYERGESQLVEPLGPEIEFQAGPTLAFLSNDKTAWPDSTQTGVSYKPLGYKIDEAGYPEFSMQLNETEITDKVWPDETEQKLSRNLNVKNANGETFIRLAKGSKIEQLPDGAYAVDDKKFYLAVTEKGEGEIFIRDVEQQELVYKPSGNTANIQYEIIW